MTAEAESIKAAFEVSRMTPEQIAADRELDIVAVKAALMQCSSTYRKACGSEPEDEDALNFSDEQLKKVNEEIYMLAVYSSDEHVKTKNLHYIRDDKKGRKDIKSHLTNNTFNILNFNESLQKAREMKERIMNGGRQSIEA